MIVIYCSTFGLRYFLGIGSTTKVVRGPWICADKGTREAELRNSCHIYNPSKPPFDKGGLWQVEHLLDNSNPIADKLCLKFSDQVTDTDAEPQPVVSGYIEFAGEIVKISSVEDIERVLVKLRG